LHNLLNIQQSILHHKHTILTIACSLSDLNGVTCRLVNGNGEPALYTEE
jgi:hypothetical protein